MKMQDFYMLKLADKVALLCSDAVVLGERWDGSFAITLLQLEDFYVEIFFHIMQGRVQNIRCFSDTEDLKVYLEQVDISALVSWQRL